MPQDPHLYGQRPAKKQKKEIALSSSVAFTSQLTSLLSTPPSAPATSTTSTSTSGRARPSKQKDDIFSVRAKRKNPPPHDGRDNDDKDGGGGRRARDKDAAKGLKLKTPVGTEDEKHDLLRARRNMEEKARLYAAMKRGDYVGPGAGSGAAAAAAAPENAPLVDFDRKWAESHPEGLDRLSSSGSDNETDDDDDDGVAGGASARELVEYKDEFGRTRTGTRAEAQRQLMRERRRRLGAEELEAMSARPTANAYHDGEHGGSGSGIIHGDVIQTEAFDVAGEDPAAAAARMEELAAGRDRAPTPPADAHFDARTEVRHKGVGFYQFATDDAARRAAQMDDLRARREETERARAGNGVAGRGTDGDGEPPGKRDGAEGEEKGGSERDKRRALIEERRRKLGRARAERLADTFLSGLAGEVGGGVAGHGEGNGDNDGHDRSGVSGGRSAETGASTA